MSDPVYTAVLVLGGFSLVVDVCGRISRRTRATVDEKPAAPEVMPEDRYAEIMRRADEELALFRRMHKPAVSLFYSATAARKPGR
jgi:hypothetical protein